MQVDVSMVGRVQGSGALQKKSLTGFWTSPMRIRRSPMSNSHVQLAKAIAEDIAHLCCVPDDWRLQISDLAAWPLPTFCAKARHHLRSPYRRRTPRTEEMSRCSSPQR